MINVIKNIYYSILNFFSVEEYYIPEDMCVVVHSEYAYKDYRNKKLIKVTKMFAELGVEVYFIDKTLNAIDGFEPFISPINYSVVSKYEKLDHLNKKRTIYLYTHFNQLEDIKMQTKYLTVFLDIYTCELIKKSSVSKQVKVTLSENPRLIVQNYQLNIFTQLIRIDKDFCLKTLFLLDALLKNKI